jgi:peptidyl-prolyl cis-trans isomerase SurA
VVPGSILYADNEGARRLRIALGFLLVFSLLSTLLGSLAGAREVVDRIVAIVEKDPIFLSEVDDALEEDLYLKSMRGEPLPRDSSELQALRREILDGVIERRIVIAKARKDGIEVTRTEVEDGLADLVKAAGSEAAFNAELERQGMNLKDFRAEYRKDVEEQLLVSRFMTQNFRDVTVDEQRLKAFYDNKYDSIPGIPEVVGLAHIIIIPRVAPEEEDRAIGKVENVLGKLENGEPFEEVAREASEDALTRDQGGLIGTVALEDLQPKLAEIAMGLKPGQTSDPTRTPYGIEIVRLDDKQGEAYTLRHIFIHLMPAKEDTTRAARLAQDIRQRIAGGESFEVMAREYSNDVDTRENGGYVGEIEIDALDPAYRSALAALQPGEVSDVVRTSRGFQIIKLVSRTASRKPSFDEAKGWIRNVIESRMREGLFDQWLEEARKEIYVKRMEF